MILNILSSFTLLVVASAHCVFSSTECNCAYKPQGGTCLRYSQGTGSSMKCEAYTCGSGYVCDCDGTEMCKIETCSKQVFNPTGSGSAPAGSIVDCVSKTVTTCVEPYAPSPSPSSTQQNGFNMGAETASPTPSSSSTPSSSNLPSPSPSASEFVSPSPSPSPSKLASVSASPSEIASTSPTPSEFSSVSASPSEFASVSASPSASISPFCSDNPN